MSTRPEYPSAEAGPPEIAALLDPADVQRALKLSSRRAARELMVHEMEHVLVGRTPMTTTAWLAEWLERRRRAPRLASSRPEPPTAATRPRRVAQRPGSLMPTPRRRVKDL